MNDLSAAPKGAAISEAIQRLTELRTSIFGLHLVGDWLGIAVGFFIFYADPTVVGFLIASVILGIAQHGLIVLGHEAVHYRICKNRSLNEWIGRLFCFFPVTLTVSSYRDFHFPHHKDPLGENDPEIPMRVAFGKNFAAPFDIARGLRLWAVSFLGFSLKETLVFASKLPGGNPREKAYLGVYWAMVLAMAYHTRSLSYVGLWYVGLLTTYISTLRIQAWYEHGSSNDMNTSRYSIPHFLYRLIMPHNIWVHYEHHKYPLIPFYHLEKVRLLDRSDRVYAFDEMVKAMSDVDPSQTEKEMGRAA